MLRPACSSATVVAAGFHPERPNVFLLAFADGILAAYDALHMFRNGSKRERRDGLARTGCFGEIGHVKGLHAAGTKSTSSDPITPPDFATLDADDEVASGGSCGGSIAVSFLPGFTARAISTGADGKCHLVDFETPDKGVSRVVRSWHVRGPATSLSVIPLKGRRSTTTPKVLNTARREETFGNVCNESLIVVGRLDGKVCMFSDSGTLRGEVIVDPAGGQILDVEWMDGPGDNVSTSRNGSRPAFRASNQNPKSLLHGSRRASTANAKRNPIAKERRKRLGSLLAAGRQVKEEVSTIEGEKTDDAESAPSSGSSTALHVSRGLPKSMTGHDAADVYAAKYMDMFSPVKLTRNDEGWLADKSTKNGSTPTVALLDHYSTLELQVPLSVPEPEQAISRVCTRDSRVSNRPRPGPRRGSQAARHASHTSRRPCHGDGKVIADIRRAAVSGKPARGFALFAPYMDRKVLVDGNRSVKLGLSKTHASTTARVKKSDQAGDDVWIDVVSNPRIPARTYSQKASTDVIRNRRNAACVHFTSITESAETKGSKQPGVHCASKESLPRGFEIHEDRSQSIKTVNSPQQVLMATQVAAKTATPLRETSLNLFSTMSSIAPLKSSGKDANAFLNEKLEEAKAALADHMRGFQAEISRQFEEHRRQVEDCLLRESVERQKVIEENRLLRVELSKANRCR